MKTKCILLLILVSAIFLCATCEKEPYENKPGENGHRTIDYRSNWYGTYECEKSATYISLLNVSVEILPVEDDSSVYIRERIIYDLNETELKVIKMKAMVNAEGFFSGIMREPDPYAQTNYVTGYFYSDSLYMKRYTAYDSMPTVPDDSVRGDIIRYSGVKMMN
ncbi:MAG: hypothetical protein IK025_03685 [Bacteroidales bacterium]|nr:hypothetical protein [Bacteroidales bacterium]